MPSEEFNQLYLDGTELYQCSLGTNPVPFQRMAEIDLLITTCRALARTKREKSIVNRTQDFWDVCFRKWHYNPTEPEETPQSEKKEIMKELPPARFEKVAMFAVLIRNIRTLKSGRGLYNTTPEELHQLMKLIEQCASIATKKVEKRVIKDAFDTYNEQFKKWQEHQTEKQADPKHKTEPKPDFDSQLSATDKLILSAHHRIIAKKMGKNNDDK